MPIKKTDPNGQIRQPAATAAESTFPARFREVVRLYPDHCALSSPLCSLTYEALDHASTAVASRILDQAGSPGDRVVILMAHDVLLVISILGVLKAGRMVMIVSPEDPPGRLNTLIRNAGACLVLTDPQHADLTRRLEISCHVVVDFGSLKSGNAPSVPDDNPGTAAFLIHTSGSGGHPKAVIQNHRNILHNAYRLGKGMELTSNDRVALLASPAGGQGLATMASALLHGATLLPFPVMERGVNGMAAWMEEKDISLFISSASLFRHFIKTLEEEKRFPKIRLVRIASEPATDSDFQLFRKHFAPDAVLFSTLSSSETGNISQARLRTGDDVQPGRLTVGFPAEDIQIRILRQDGSEASPGETGEIIVKSRYLAPGYWGDPKLTSERFTRPDPADESRTYRSGDRGFYREDGSLMFVGRDDHRVKIRGYRIEVREVEDVLLSHDLVEQAVVDVRENSLGETRLAAYVVLQQGTRVSTTMLRSLIRKYLPAHMVPGFFVFLESFPFNANGKIDRSRLRTLEVKNSGQQGASLPETETERFLASFWQLIFETENISREDHFFDLGGDSLSAVVLSAKIYEKWGMEIHLKTLAEYPRLIDLARLLDERKKILPEGQAQGILRVPRKGSFPLSFTQERCWNYSQTPEDSAGYTVSCNYSLKGPLNESLFRQCLDQLVERHEILRMEFSVKDGTPVQTIRPPCPADFTFVDLSKEKNPLSQADVFFKTESKRVFDVTQFPLIKFWLLKLADQDYWLIRCGHHILTDGWSWALFCRELGFLYEAGLSGTGSPFTDDDRVQYVDYAVWQRTQFHPESAAYRTTMEWWRKQFHQHPKPVRLPFLRPVKIPGASPEEGVIRWGLENTVSERLDDLTRRENSTYFVTRLAVFTALLFRATGQDDLVLGTYVSTRDRLEIQNMFGFVSNVATLRFRCRQGLTFRAWLSEVRQLMMEVQTHNAIPYEELRKEFSEKKIPVPEIQMLFSISSHHLCTRFGEIQMKWLDRQMEAMPWGFSARFDSADEQGNCRMTFDARIYDPAGVRLFIQAFSNLLRDASLDPNATLDNLYKKCGAAQLYPESLIRRGARYLRSLRFV